MKNTKIAVLMAAYNSEEKILNETIQSILSSELELDLILVDDGSHKKIEDIIKKNERIITIRTNKNNGLTKALNIGIDYILKNNYEYIARMDVGDICKKNRFTEQLKYLEENKEIDGVGCWYEYFDTETREITKIIKGPTTESEIGLKLRYNSPMAHPTWFFRSSVFIKLNGYNELYKTAQDYEFLYRAWSLGYRYINLDKSLILCADDNQGISIKKRKNQIKNRIKIQTEYFQAKKISSWIGILRSITTLLIPQKIMARLKLYIYKK